MAATMHQFLTEAAPIIKNLYCQHHNSRSTYKEACEDVALRKMPRATETDRAKFVGFAMRCFDQLAKSGAEPDDSMQEMGQKLATQRQRKIILAN